MAVLQFINKGRTYFSIFVLVPFFMIGFSPSRPLPNHKIAASINLGNMIQALHPGERVWASLSITRKSDDFPKHSSQQSFLASCYPKRATRPGSELVQADLLTTALRPTRLTQELMLSLMKIAVLQ